MRGRSWWFGNERPLRAERAANVAVAHRYDVAARDIIPRGEAGDGQGGYDPQRGEGVIARSAFPR